jgi:hypothetical protein
VIGKIGTKVESMQGEEDGRHGKQQEFQEGKGGPRPT